MIVGEEKIYLCTVSVMIIGGNNYLFVYSAGKEREMMWRVSEISSD